MALETGFHYTAQAGFELVILLSQLLECWDYRFGLPTMCRFSQALFRKRLSKAWGPWSSVVGAEGIQRSHILKVIVPIHSADSVSPLGR